MSKFTKEQLQWFLIAKSTKRRTLSTEQLDFVMHNYNELQIAAILTAYNFYEIIANFCLKVLYV